MSVTDASRAKMPEDNVISEDKQWLDLVIPKIAENIDPRKIDTFYELKKSENRFLSEIYFVKIYCMNETNRLREMQNVVIKRAKDVLVMDGKTQFHNEILFYKMFYQTNENFPKCLYTYEPLLKSDYSIIVLEDVSISGFAGCPVSFDAPYNYVLAVMRELGRFHAKGYILKETNQAKFFSIVDKIEETRFNERGQRFQQYIDITSTRAVEYLRDNNYDADFCDRMEAVLSNAFERVMKRVSTVTESSKLLATICHGDVTLTNALFQSQSNGHFNAMLIDFGMLRYGTPVIDLSTFLCLTCTNDTMRDKLYDILTVYHLALTNYMLQEGVTDIQKYSYNAILNDYKQGCLFGFVIASFFLVTELGYVDDFAEVDAEDMEKHAKETKKLGGEKVSAMLAEMLLQMAEFGRLDYYA